MRGLTRPQVFGGIVCQERASVAQRFGSRRPIKLGEIYDDACASESVGNDRLTPLAEFEGNDERWSTQLHTPMFGLAGSARKIGITQWGPRTSLRQPSALGGRRRDRAGNAR